MLKKVVTALPLLNNLENGPRNQKHEQTHRGMKSIFRSPHIELILQFLSSYSRLTRIKTKTEEREREGEREREKRERKVESKGEGWV